MVRKLTFSKMREMTFEIEDQCGLKKTMDIPSVVREYCRDHSIDYSKDEFDFMCLNIQNDLKLQQEAA